MVDLLHYVSIPILLLVSFLLMKWYIDLQSTAHCCCLSQKGDICFLGAQTTGGKFPVIDSKHCTSSDTLAPPWFLKVPFKERLSRTFPHDQHTGWLVFDLTTFCYLCVGGNLLPWRSWNTMPARRK